MDRNLRDAPCFAAYRLLEKQFIALAQIAAVKGNILSPKDCLAGYFVLATNRLLVKGNR